MTNKEVLERGVSHESEQLMYFLLSDFWEKLKEKGYVKGYGQCPINLVSVYKDFLKQETIVDTNIYDKYHPIKESDVIDVEYTDVQMTDGPEFTITERTEPFTLDEAFDYVDEAGMDKLTAHNLKCLIVEVVQDEKAKTVDEFTEKMQAIYQNTKNIPKVEKDFVSDNLDRVSGELKEEYGLDCEKEEDLER
jgi:hypothetical protein